MSEFKPHDYFEADDKGYISRKVFIEHVRNTYDHMRELATLIKGYDQTIDAYLERWDQNLESLDDSIIGLLHEWIDDSTFATIINEEIFNTKADQDEVFLKKNGININDLDEPTRQTFLKAQGIDVNYVLGEKNVKPENTTFISIGKNKIDLSKSITGYIGASSGAMVESADYKTTDFIYVNIGQKIIISPKIRKFLAYDIDKNSIASSYLNASSETPYIYTATENCYVRLSYENAVEQSIMLEFVSVKTIEPTTYEPFRYEIDKNITLPNETIEYVLSKIEANSSPLNDKALFSIGDSIMSGDGNGAIGIADILGAKYGMTVTDLSKGGATVAWDENDAESESETTKRQNIQYQAQLALSYPEPDYILINGGTNDIPNFPLGDYETSSASFKTTYDITTFSGGLETIFQQLKNTFPNAIIVFVEVHRGARPYSYQKTYGDRAEELCDKWSVKYVDIGKESGMNTQLSIYSQYTNKTQSSPDGDNVHPTQLGYDEFYIPAIESVLINLSRK